MKSEEIIVSVCMITYNHQKFISEAIEGVLMQKTTFPIELIIGEDCSTDATRSICIDYQNKYPDIIKLQLPDTNKGMMRNFIENMQAATGRYIALCEGDDYWTDPYKLQKQVEFLEANKDYSIVSHNALKVNYFDGSSLKMNNFESNLDFSFNDMLNRLLTIPTASIVFKNTTIPDWITFCKVGDWPLLSWLLNNGKGYYFCETMSVYSKHEKGMSVDIQKRNHNRILLETFLIIEQHNKNYLVEKHISSLAFNAFVYELNHSKIELKLLLIALKYDFSKMYFYSKHLLKLYLIKNWRYKK